MIKHKGTVELKSERIILRKYLLSDAYNMYKNYASDEKTTKFLSWYPYRDVKEVETFLQDRIDEYSNLDNYHWAIEYNKEIIGSISAIHVDQLNNSVEIGYCIGSKFWNMGITSEAVRLVIDYFFHEIGIHRIMAKHDIDNPASGKVMLKNNMTYEGTFKEHYLRKDGTYSDAIVYGIINN